MGKVRNGERHFVSTYESSTWLMGFRCGAFRLGIGRRVEQSTDPRGVGRARRHRAHSLA